MRITASKIGVFWDYENCRPPPNIPGSKLVANIRRRVQPFDPIKVFKAYVDLSLESTNPRSVTLRSDLQSSGLTLVHCPHNGVKDVVDKMMIVDLMTFALDNPPPATIAIITGDRDLTYAAAVLKLRGYRITVIAPSWACPGLKMQADELFDWHRDVTGADEQARSTADPCESVNVSAVDVQSQQRLAPPPKSELSQTSHKPANVTNSSMPGINRTEDSMKHATSTTPLPANPPNGALDRVLTSRHGFEGACTLDFESDADEDDDDCGCAICTRPTGVIRPSHGSTNKKADVAIQASLPKVPPDGNAIDVDPKLTTAVPSSVSSNVSSTNTVEASSIGSEREKLNDDLLDLWKNIYRLKPLIVCFIQQRDLLGTKRLRASVVASAMLKMKPNVYQIAGVAGMKQYVEQARQAEVVLPAQGNEGDDWIELNPAFDNLNWDFTQKEQSVMPETQAAKPNPITSGAKITADPIFKPLVERLRAESPSYKVERTLLGTFFKEKHPDLYKRAGASRLAKYLEMAEKRGLVIPDTKKKWVKLAPAHRHG